MSDRYDYSNISDNSKKIAIKELNENPDQVNAHIESFRRWVKSMHHLTCPTDSAFLIKFLRVAKYDHKKAQKRLDNFCTVRSSERGSPHFFKHYKLDNPSIMKVLNLKQQIPLGKNDAGEEVFLIRPRAWNPDEIPVEEMFNVMFMGFDCIISNEEVQIHGLTILVDLAGISRKAFEVWADPKLSRQFTRINQDSYPIRSKAQVFYNEPIIFDIVFNVISFFMSEKMKGRTFRVKHDINKAMEKIPGLKRILPSEYGGESGTTEECADRWVTKFMDYFKNGSPYKDIKVDESKRPKETMEYLAEFAEYKGVTLGTAGTYTKFENLY